MFVGQRREGFAVNLGEVFDLVNLNPLGGRDVKGSATADKNITSLALEVPIACLTATATQPIIGAWTTALQCGQRTFRPRRFIPTAIRFPQCGQLKLTVCIRFAGYGM